MIKKFCSFTYYLYAITLIFYGILGILNSINLEDLSTLCAGILLITGKYWRNI